MVVYGASIGPECAWLSPAIQTLTGRIYAHIFTIGSGGGIRTLAKGLTGLCTTLLCYPGMIFISGTAACSHFLIWNTQPYQIINTGLAFLYKTKYGLKLSQPVKVRATF
jgi:hypothetical protein